MPGSLALFEDRLTMDEAWEIVRRIPLDASIVRRGRARRYWYADTPDRKDIWIGKDDAHARVVRAHDMIRERLEACESVRELRGLEARAYARPPASSRKAPSRPKGLRGRPRRTAP